jgi:hypothetical protein
VTGDPPVLPDVLFQRAALERCFHRGPRQAARRAAFHRIGADPEAESPSSIAAHFRGEARPRRLLRRQVSPCQAANATIKEACRYGRFSHTKCYELINDKRIKAYKFDTRALVDLDSIDAMYASLPEM